MDEKEKNITFNEKNKKGLINGILQELIISKEIVVIYTDNENTNTFSVGYILAYSENEIVVAYVDEFGNNDGFLGKKTYNIIKLEYRSKYSNKIQKLNKIRGNSINFISVHNESLFLDIMIYAYKFKKIVSIELFNSGIDDAVGYIISIEGNSAKIKMVNSYGEDDGEMIINIKDITDIACDTNYQKSLDLLFQHQDQKIV